MLKNVFCVGIIYDTLGGVKYDTLITEYNMLNTEYNFE